MQLYRKKDERIETTVISAEAGHMSDSGGHTSPRNQQFAILSAFATIFTVMGHTGVSIGSVEWLFHYDSYHMPLFVFISGYFFRAEETTISNTRGYILKQVKRLLLPFFAWNFFYGCISVLASRILGITWCNADQFWYELLVRPFTWGNVFFQLNAPSWFLLALFEVKIVNWFLRIALNKRKCPEWGILCLYFIIACAAITYARTMERTALAIKATRALYLMFWFEAGCFYKRVLERRDTASNSCYFFVVLAFQFWLTLVCGSKGIVAGVWNSEFTNCAGLTIFAAATGIAFFLRLSRILTPSLGDSPLVDRISRHTFSIMMHQIGSFTLLSLFYYLAAGFFHSGDFDLYAFQTDFWYRYCPGGLWSFRILYVIAGIWIPLAGCRLYDFCTIFRNRIHKRLSNVWK